ncbi:unnamed protein product [Adineta steineri]|uniref:Putative auto-transporter adhesin head GIN domain-containing protein n=1 Tax=Adineta steineri TaxID=433720 RepID=A0A815HDD9_9BILA|nr:unnamed protein product [Adineta steineri]CAF3520595.1 unnamed protein product [Adineta steineri]
MKIVYIFVIFHSISNSINYQLDTLAIIGDKNITHRNYRITQSFSKLSINGPFYCYVTWTNTDQTLDIYTDNNIHPYVIINIENDKLKIAIQSNVNFKYTKMNIYLNLHPFIKEIFLAGISTLYSRNLLYMNHLLKLHTQDTTNLILQLDVFDLDALFLSAETTKLIGHVKHKARIRYHGIGDVDAFYLICKFIDLTANALGTIWITGTMECVIKAEGISIVRYNCSNINHIQSIDLAQIISI